MLKQKQNYFLNIGFCECHSWKHWLRVILVLAGQILIDLVSRLVCVATVLVVLDVMALKHRNKFLQGFLWLKVLVPGSRLDIGIQTVDHGVSKLQFYYKMYKVQCLAVVWFKNRGMFPPETRHVSSNEHPSSGGPIKWGLGPYSWHIIRGVYQ